MPIKEENYWTLSIIGRKNSQSIITTEQYYDNLNRIIKEIKDICPICKQVIDEIFRLRKNNLYLLSEELYGIWRLKNEK